MLGALLSLLVAPGGLVVASVMAYLLAEFGDLAVYAPLRERRLWLAVLASGIVGATIDSAVFLLIAFGSIDFIAGQVAGKIYTSVAIAFFLLLKSRLGGEPGKVSLS